MLLDTMAARRAALRTQFDVSREFETIEESCVPSYIHRNFIAAWTAWRRLEVAATLYRRFAGAGPILDFGSGTGELFQVLKPRGAYSFVEENETLVRSLQRNIAGARREKLDELCPGRFAAVFALDSLEHNQDIAQIIDRLAEALSPDGVMILSGPTENRLYRLGRSLAGFDGHYHVQTVHDIERQMGTRLTMIGRRMEPIGLPLFAISAWRRSDAPGVSRARSWKHLI